MNEIKLSLSIVLPGRILLSEQECSKNPKESYFNNVVVVENENHKKEILHFQTRKSRIARQSLNINKASYDYMTAKSSNAKMDALNCPEWAKPKEWFKLSKTQRLEAHLLRITRSLGGISYTYQVFDN